MTAKSAVQIVVVIVAVVLGWTLGQAQNSSPDFELVVSAPGGSTTIECRRGCELAWVERGVNPRSTTMRTFQFKCTGSECSSGAVGGWVTTQDRR